MARIELNGSQIEKIGLIFLSFFPVTARDAQIKFCVKVLTDTFTQLKQKKTATFKSSRHSPFNGLTSAKIPECLILLYLFSVANNTKCVTPKYER